MTPAGQALVDEVKRMCENSDLGKVASKAAKETFGIEPWGERDVQLMIEAGCEFAGDDFHRRLGVAIALIHLGYRVAQKELENNKHE